MPPLVPVAVGVLSGERPDALVWVGILIALPGIWLVAREPATGAGPAAVRDSSTACSPVWASASLFAALAQIPEEAGFLPLALNQVVAGVAIVAVATALRSPWLPREPRALGGVVSGALGALATGSFLVATHGGYLTVTAVHRLALPRLHGDAGGLRPARARAPRPGDRARPVRGGGHAGRGGLSSPRLRSRARPGTT